MINKNTLLLVGVGAAALLIFSRYAREVGKAAAHAVNDAATGAVVGIGEAVGVPETDADKCSAALSDGRYWDASFYCPAPDFFSGVYDAITSPDKGVSDVDYATSKMYELPPVL